MCVCLCVYVMYMNKNGFECALFHYGNDFLPWHQPKKYDARNSNSRPLSLHRNSEPRSVCIKCIQRKQE